MKSLLSKVENLNVAFQKITDEYVKEIVLLLLDKAAILTKAYMTKELNVIADYLYNLTSAYNRFYEHNRILTEKDEVTKESWIALTKLVFDTNVELLTILSIKKKKKM